MNLTQRRSKIYLIESRESIRNVPSLRTTIPEEIELGECIARNGRILK
jgi:hypothetical protein